jgi:ribosomal protein L29
MIDLFSGVTKTGAVVGSLGVIVAGIASTLAFTDLKPVLARDFRIVQAQLEAQIDNLSKAQLLIRFQQLEQKLKFGPLTFDEEQERCRIARVLGYVNVPGCP